VLGHAEQHHPAHACPAEHADFLAHIAATANIPLSRIRALVMDTTHGNPAVLRTDLFKHAAYVECLQHVACLVLHDLMKVPAFAAAHDSAKDFSTWLRKMERRLLAVHNFAEKKLCPIGASNTRFGQHLLVIARIVELWAALTQAYAHVGQNKPLFNGANKDDDPKTVTDFKAHYMAVAGNFAVLTELTKLAKPFMACTTYLGSARAYTSGSLYAVFELLWAAGANMRTSADANVAAIGLAFQSSMLERFATLCLWDKHRLEAAFPVPSYAKPGADLNSKLALDVRHFSAMLLDPAAFPKALSRVPPGDWQGPVVDYLYAKIIVPIARRVDDDKAPPKGPLMSERKAYFAERKRIRELPPPPGFAPAAWELIKAQQLKDAQRAGMGDGEGSDGEDAAAAAGAGGVLDPMLPLQLALRKEFEEHVKVLVRHATKKFADPNYAPFGGELQEGPPDRYQYWPSVEKQFPLLYLSAVTLLACDGNSTCENERAHSPAGRITEPYRARMKPAKVEQLTLAYFMIRKRAEADTRKQMEAWAKASLDQRAAEEELLATKELEAEWAREAQGASDSDDDVVLVEPKRAARGGGGGGDDARGGGRHHFERGGHGVPGGPGGEGQLFMPGAQGQQSVRVSCCA
jgi:hypothetical protein